MRGKRSTAGIAIITAISFMVVTLAFISTAFIVSISNTRLSGDQVSTTKAQFAAQAGIDEAILRVWHGATEDINATGAITGRRDIPDYRERWENITNWSPYTWDSGGKLIGDADGDGMPIFGNPISFSGQVDDGTGNLASYEVTIERRDDNTESSTLRIISTGTLPNGSRRRLQQDLNVAYPPFQLDFALLTDFVNCTFCHSAFTSIEMGYNADPNIGMADEQFLVDLTDENARESAAEGKQRIRVAGLNDAFIITGYKYLNTLVAGTIYTRGPQNVMHTSTGCGKNNKCEVIGPVFQDNSPIITDQDWEGFNTDDAPKSKDRLYECTQNINDGNANCDERFGRFYANYPLEIEAQPAPIDGTIPAVQEFPSPIKDLNGDKRIDNAEWTATLTDKDIGTFIDAESVWFYPTDVNGVSTSANNITLPFNVRGQPAVVSGLETTAANVVTQPGRGIAGNLFVIGTDTNPIEIDGAVYVDGDLVIQGPIAPGNRGLFIVRRNIYILGDVVYDCNGNTAGTGCDYTEPRTLPRFAMVSGGMMVMGDPNQSSSQSGFPNNFNRRGGNLPIQGELLAFNRKQFEKYEEAKEDATSLANSFVPRYYLYREGDELVMRCDIYECRDFIARTGGNRSSEAREHIPCVAGQIAVWGSNQPNCNNFTVRDPSLAVGDDDAYQDFKDNNGGAWNWGMESEQMGGVPVELDDDGFVNLVGEIFVRDRNDQFILDTDGNRVEPAYVFMSPFNSWLAPTNDLNGNGTADDVDTDLVLMDKVFGRQNAIAAMEVLSGAWIKYGLENGRASNNQRPMRIDALLFTNSAIVSYLPNRGTTSNTAGGLIINGSIISYETGLLIYGAGNKTQRAGESDCAHGQNKGMFETENWRCVGLRLQYDRRLPGLIDLRIEVPVLLRSRSQWLEITD